MSAWVSRKKTSITIIKLLTGGVNFKILLGAKHLAKILKFTPLVNNTATGIEFFVAYPSRHL